MRYVRACRGAFMVQMKIRVIDPGAYAALLFFPLILMLVALYMLGPHNQAHAVYAVFGGALTGFWGFTWLDSGGSLTEERWTGTLEQVMGCPTPLAVIVIGKTLSAMVVGLLGFVPAIALAYLVGARIPPVQPVAFAVSIAVLVVSFFAVGLLFAPVFALVRWAFAIVNGLELFVYIVCGFMFPISQLPGWLQVVSVLLPPTWAVRALYGSTGTAAGAAALGSWWLLTLALSLGYLALSWWFFVWVGRRSRESGQLATA